MTDRQENFCLEYAKSGNATQAYMDSGYSVKDAKSAAVNASRMLRNANVKARIDELRAKIKSDKILTIEQRKEILTTIAGDTESTKQDKIKAIDTLNKMDGVYLNRTEITGGMPVVICDDLTEDKRQSSVG